MSYYVGMVELIILSLLVNYLPFRAEMILEEHSGLTENVIGYILFLKFSRYYIMWQFYLIWNVAWETFFFQIGDVNY